MDHVGVRELSHHTSRYLAEVKPGKSFEVTERGRVIATLTAAAGQDAMRRPRPKIGGYRSEKH